MTQNGQPVLLDQLRVYIASDQQRNAANPLLTEFLTKAQEQHCPWDGLACIRCDTNHTANIQYVLTASSVQLFWLLHP